MIRRVLLQPDTETIVSDVEQICADHADWTSDDCLKIEQSLVVPCVWWRVRRCVLLLCAHAMNLRSSAGDRSSAVP